METDVLDNVENKNEGEHYEDIIFEDTQHMQKAPSADNFTDKDTL